MVSTGGNMITITCDVCGIECYETYELAHEGRYKTWLVNVCRICHSDTVKDLCKRRNDRIRGECLKLTEDDLIKYSGCNKPCKLCGRISTYEVKANGS